MRDSIIGINNGQIKCPLFPSYLILGRYSKKIIEDAGKRLKGGN